ncbi:gamma-glutamyltransferase [Embleya scabrispora]|uniref:Gamma-glutamyltransferase n=1 Tax=Embleya scabrispora TaxID=159449 RepID=A0A1T3NR85_9ACTN|nr:gamma-glutamyltransferase [Embleya scabrispora]OPC79202.1 gamma-glutamyltransferase [Embleya scabrispora]
MSDWTSRPTVRGTFGVVSTTHWLASQSAMAVLEDGGNAFDAAVAAGFVLQVVQPHLNGPAGEVPIILAPVGGAVRVLCGQGPAPQGATIEHYRSLGLDLVPGTGPLAAAVPGSFDAWLTLLRDHGTKPLAEVLTYAIGYAESGHPVSPLLAATVARMREQFETEWTTSAEVYLPAPETGTLFRNPALARTWRTLLRACAGGTREAEIEAARRIWREGFIGEAVADFAAKPAMDTSGRRHASTLVGDDLVRYAASYEEPAGHDWRGWTVYKPGAWSQGPVFLQQLALLSDEFGYDDPEYVHILVEGTKLAMADREAWYGDAAPVPLDDLLSGGYNAGRRAMIDARASHELRPGTPGGRIPLLPGLPVAQGEAPAASIRPPGTGEPTVRADGVTRGDTCHLDVADRWGNLVSATPSGGWLQSSPAIPGLGFPLGTRLQMAWLEPDLPNSLTPGRRPRTTLSPSIAARDGVPVLAFGTPGGDQQDQWSLHFFLAVALGGLDLQAAIDAPNWHTASFPGSFHPRTMSPGSLTVESRLGDRAITALRERGHLVTVDEPWSQGRLCAVARDPHTGVLSAAADSRGVQGYAVGR